VNFDPMSLANASHTVSYSAQRPPNLESEPSGLSPDGHNFVKILFELNRSDQDITAKVHFPSSLRRVRK
jgi:hypothetical protein